MTHSGFNLKSVENLQTSCPFTSRPYVLKDLRFDFNPLWNSINAYGTVRFMGCTPAMASSDLTIPGRVNGVEVCPFPLSYPWDRNVPSQEAPPHSEFGHQQGEVHEHGQASGAVTILFSVALDAEGLGELQSLPCLLEVPCWTPTGVFPQWQDTSKQGEASVQWPESKDYFKLALDLGSDISVWKLL